MIDIIAPPRRVTGNVIADHRQVAVGLDDVFVVVPLPDGVVGGLAQGVAAFGGYIT